jgi:hypothetical protein
VGTWLRFGERKPCATAEVPEFAADPGSRAAAAIVKCDGSAELLIKTMLNWQLYCHNR